MNAMIRRGSIAVVVLLVLGALPLAAEASPPDAPWGGSGLSTLGPATVTNVAAAGDDGPAVFAYDNFAPVEGGVGAQGAWDFNTIYAGATPATISLDYQYSGFHAFFQVTVTLEAYVSDGVTTTVVPLVAAGPAICCTTPSAGFSYSGTVALDVEVGDTYGFRMTGTNGDSNSRLRGRLMVDDAPFAADTRVVNGFDAARTDGDAGLTEPLFATTRSYLADPAVFGGPGAPEDTDFVVADGLSTATAASLLGTDVFVTGSVPTASYTPAERQALVDFVLGGGTLIATTDDTGHTMVDAFGITQSNGTSNLSTFVRADHPIADGPFGVQGAFAQDPSSGSYADLGPDASAVARNSAARATLAEINPGQLGAGSGLALFLADVDLLTDPDAAANEVLIENLFAYVADPVLPPSPGDPGSAALLQAVPSGGTTIVAARFMGPPGEARTLEVLTSSSCADGVLGGVPTSIGSLAATPDANGEGFVTGSVGVADSFVAARLVGVSTTSALSPCIAVGPDNDTWTRALPVPLVGGALRSGAASGFVDAAGTARWYRFDIVPGARVEVELSGMAADYDLALFKDINQAFVGLTAGDDTDVDALHRLSAEFAPSAFSPSAFSPSAFSPSAFSPSAFSPSAFSPSAFSPSVFSPSAFSPSAFSPSAFSPSAFSPSAFSPSAFSPSAFSPSAFSPSAFSPAAFSAENFANAQTRSLLSVSAQAGTATETLVADTWGNTGSFYVRVTGKNGAFDVDDDFQLAVTLDGALCDGVVPIAPATPVVAPAGGYQTIVLADPGRVDGALAGNGTAERAAVDANLRAYAARAEVRGVIVDLGSFPHIGQLHAQADAHSSCPYAENLTAQAIKDIVDAYRSTNPDLAYVTIVGSDTQVPFFRYPDQALLGPEQDYDPPVADGTQSQSSLRLNYVLGQDEYGASTSISLQDGDFPIPALAVGRLVESATQINAVLEAYLATADGVVDMPTSTLVTGYDFLTDTAEAVQAELVAGTVGASNDTLITAADISPADPRSWTADQLRAELLGEGDDVVFLAGHFSANSALAADYETVALATELAASDVDLANAIIFSAGCHAGYNIADGDVVPGLTEPVDWAQAFAGHGATLIAGTGYQYGDTDFIEYSERLYLNLAQELRRGTGPVAIGEALVRAKQDYLGSTPELRGLHRKSVLESTLFGLPNLRIDMPGQRIPEPPTSSDVAPTPVTSDPGLTLGLLSADVSLDLDGALVPRSVLLTNLEGGVLTATYLEGPDGVVTNVAEPALPLVTRDVSVPGQVLRGIGFRSGSWTEQPVVPLTGAPSTELRGVHTPFASLVNFPMRLASANYLGELTGAGGTVLNVTPAQHRVSALGDLVATLRQFADLDLRLFYSNNTQSYAVPGGGVNVPALAAAPTVTSVSAGTDGDDVVFEARVVGDPSAGIQGVWVTYTDGSGSSGEWTSLDLVQDPSDSTRWSGRLIGGALASGRLDYLVQAVNGVGLVAVDDNFGAYYSIAGAIGAPPVEPVATALALTAPASATFGDTVALSATVTAGGVPVPNAPVAFAVGSTTRVATTSATGTATVEVPITSPAGTLTVTASFGGTVDLAASSASQDLTVAKAATTLEIVTVDEGGTPGYAAQLRSGDSPLLSRTVYVEVTGPSGTERSVLITDNVGQARLSSLLQPNGLQTVTVRFLGAIPTGTGVFQVTDPVYQPSAADLTLIAGNALTVPTAPARVGTPVQLRVATGPSVFGGSFTATVRWGDGSVQPLTAALVSHTYAAAGVYTIRVDVVDGPFTTTATSSAVVVYDPAPAVAGLGQISSPTGALVGAPTVSGPATFAFAAAYPRNGTVPVGLTTFALPRGNFLFTSITNDWLVVSGTQLQLHGRGRVNGSGSYDFLVTADDARPDRFRIQIWNRTNGALVYDNLKGVNGPGTPLSNGSISISRPR
jgi:hypothetical protein